jgi:putative SOS response-associated peptidase YedK
MCGRVKLEGDFSQLRVLFGIPDDCPAPNYAPSWNVAPTDSLPIVRYNAKEGHRTLDLMRWGLVPYWAKSLKVGVSAINAMAETVDVKSMFRKAFAQRRCLVGIEVFYEWHKLGPKEKQPYAIALAGGDIMALAGLWENWRSPDNEWVRSFTIITTVPNELCGQIHDRMPVILPPKVWPLWLGEEAAEERDLKAMLVPYPTDDMIMWPVSPRVGSVKNNDPSLIEPIEA